MTRRHVTRLLVALSTLALLSTPAVGAAAAMFEDGVVLADRQAVQTAVLGPLANLGAARGASGSAEVTWSTATARPDVEPEYVVDRTVGSVTTRITPAPAESGTTTSFSDDLGVPASIDHQPVTQVSAGNEHTCAIAGGTAYCWGDGWLGTSPYQSSSTSPVKVSELPEGTVTEIAAGGQHTCAVAGGDLYCWGDGQWGQLGRGWEPYAGLPQRVDGLTSPVTSLTAGYRFTCAVAGGAVYCWGYHYEGQLGNGTRSEASTPTAVVGLDGHTMAQVTAGTSHACARSVAGALWCWGYGADGRLGQYLERYVVDSLTPLLVPTLTNVTDVTAGDEHTCAIASSTAYCWGSGHYGQLGTGAYETTRGEPVAVSGLPTVSQIEAGWTHTCAISGGLAWCWGDGYFGALGLGDRTDRNAPAALALAGPTAVSGGQSHSCAIAQGALQCWGIGWSGKLGNGGTSDQNSPTAVVDDLFTGSSCPADWLVHGTRCVPGPNVPVSYQVGYVKRGWSAPPVTVTSTWSS